MREKIKITFILPSLTAGGAERVVSFISQNIDKQLFEPTLLIIYGSAKTSYDTKGVNLIYLNKSRVRNGLFGIIKHIRTLKPDIVLSSISHLNALTAIISIFFFKTKFIGRETNVLSVVRQFRNGNSSFSKILTSVSYRFFDRIICQSVDMLEDMHKNYSLPRKKLVLINNPITDDFELKEVNTDHSAKRFITVASFKKQKGHLRILEALSKYNGPFEYLMVGDGKEKEAIYSKIKELGLSDMIKHIPYTDTVSSHLAQSDYFLQGSYVEGFANCLLESSAVGTPIIAFNAPGGLNEIILEGINGYIANDEQEFVSYLSSENKWKPKEVSKAVTERFSKEIIIKKYEGLFLNTIAKN